jgi:hypothetical protein
MEIQTMARCDHQELKKSDERIEVLSKELILIRKELELLFSNEDNSFEEFQRIEHLVDREKEVSQEISHLSKRNLFLSFLLIKKKEIQN